ncbi:MAG TPA: TlyA family RNA methyltransferase [Paracoccaceae bacterium]|nr:TlyA family RNA methyltransferase [Paracoccaceae bacterium]
MTPRLDQRLVDLGLAPSRARARALIEAGAVRVGGRPVTRPAARTEGEVEVAETFPWVGRGALKLLHALDRFGLTPQGSALDIGASTGGFTQVLLARGAAHVTALDVGHGQFDPSLRADPRVTVLEGVNARALPPLAPPDWITADVSFISLKLALPPALALACPGAQLVALVKPQFEAGPAHVGKGGIVRDPAVHARVCDEIAAFLAAAGWQILGLTESPVGGDGNREFLIAARKPG